MSMFCEPPSPGNKPHYPLVETAFEGQLGDPSFGLAGTIMLLVDLWLEEGRLPDYMRTSPRVP
ncbi:MAG: hypothetical protein EOP21_00830, partial [Hyphomicrobiales bacterium]